MVILPVIMRQDDTIFTRQPPFLYRYYVNGNSCLYNLIWQDPGSGFTFQGITDVVVPTEGLDLFKAVKKTNSLYKLGKMDMLNEI